MSPDKIAKVFFLCSYVKESVSVLSLERGVSRGDLKALFVWKKAKSKKRTLVTDDGGEEGGCDYRFVSFGAAAC